MEDKSRAAIESAVADRCAHPNCCYTTAIPEILLSLDLAMTTEDVAYLIQTVKSNCPPCKGKPAEKP
jgi:hypothetical protein